MGGQEGYVIKRRKGNVEKGEQGGTKSKHGEVERGGGQELSQLLEIGPK